MVSQEQLEVWRQILLDQKAGESAGMQTGFDLEWLKYIDKLQADRKALLDGQGQHRRQGGKTLPVELGADGERVGGRVILIRFRDVGRGGSGSFAAPVDLVDDLEVEPGGRGDGAHEKDRNDAAG